MDLSKTVLKGEINMWKLKKLKWRILILFLTCLVSITSAAFAGSISFRAGYVPVGYSSSLDLSLTEGRTVYNAKGQALSTGNNVEAYWVGTNGVINDPGSPGNDDVLIPTTDNKIGNDNDTWSLFSGQDGKFYHEFDLMGGAVSSGADIYIRVWDGTTTFGESNIINVVYEEGTTPSDYSLITTEDNTGTTTLLTNGTAPTPPALGTITNNGAQSGGTPSIIITCKSSVHGRWYEFEVSTPAATNQGPFTYIYKSAKSDNLKHAADINTTGPKTSGTITLGKTDDNKWIKVRARAVNVYGASAWIESVAMQIPETPDSNNPIAVTDLTLSKNDRSITLKWSAPYDLDKYTQPIACSGYDIRVSTEAIVGEVANPFTQGQTNASNTNTWDDTPSISTYFMNELGKDFQLSTPKAYGNPESLTISNINTDGNYFFAIKAKDSGDKWSYISNVAGIQVGEAKAAAPETVTYTLSYEAGGLGINNISIPFSTPFNDPSNVTTLLDLVNFINEQAGSGEKIVYAVGWWDGQQMKPAGYEIKYDSTGAISTTGTNTAPNIAAAAITKDMPYQISVTKKVTFDITGVR